MSKEKGIQETKETPTVSAASRQAIVKTERKPQAQKESPEAEYARRVREGNY